MAFPPEVLLNSDHHHETLVNLALKKCIKAKEGYFFFFLVGKETYPTVAVKLFGYLYYLFWFVGCCFLL